ncbi:MAG TPA: hypothetical protein VMR08_01895 [Patescibacteria group bacterium]|jgi:guanylate kinase|nr:hypothetical protein [Patescibacteria group bacterium]
MPITRKNSPILVIIGPSGAGKSTVVKRLASKGLILVNPTWTTRPPRPREIEESVEHRFISKVEFSKLEKQGFFLECVDMFGLPYRYGLPKVVPSTLRQVSVVMLRSVLIPRFNKYYPNHVIYQIEDELSQVRLRLLDRQQKGEKLGTRLEDYQTEVAAGRKYANRIFINSKSIDLLASQVEQAIGQDLTKP